MKRAIIEQEEMEAGRVSRSKVVEEELKALGIKSGQFEKETLSSEGFDVPVQVETLEAIGRGHERLDTARREPTTQNGQESTPTFVLHPQPPLRIALLLSVRYARVELRTERSLELDRVLGLFFGCERRGALSFALSL